MGTTPLAGGISIWMYIDLAIVGCGLVIVLIPHLQSQCARRAQTLLAASGSLIGVLLLFWELLAAR